jgi:hypothetical protein
MPISTYRLIGALLDATLEMASFKGRSPMTMQSDSKGHGLANNLLLQFGLVAVVAVILIALAAYYVW